MPVEERRHLIKEIERQRQSRVVALVTGDRPSDIPIPGMNANIAGDQVPLLYEHIRRIGRADKIDLFLYTRGGDTSIPWPLVNLIRDACERFAVLVPHRAHSAGTLICLGADEVVMCPAGELSPVDPTTGNQFNPPDPMNPGARLGINVEDATSYIALATDKVGLSDKAHLLAVFKELAHQVHPLALGNVNRTHTLIRILARKLLSLHMAGPDLEAEGQKIIDTLTEKLYSHLHFVARREAKDDIGLKVTLPSTDIENLMWALYEVYQADLRLGELFVADAYLGTEREKELSLEAAVIESADMTHTCRAVCQLRREPQITPELLAPVLSMALQARAQGNPIDDLPLVRGLPVGITVRPIRVGWEREEASEPSC